MSKSLICGWKHDINKTNTLNIAKTQCKLVRIFHMWVFFRAEFQI